MAGGRRAVDTVLFDIDGTLVDSNYLHVSAWGRALARVGHPAPAWRVHRAIGMDSEALLDELAGDASTSVREQADALHSAYYQEGADALRPFEGAAELLRSLRKRGLNVVLATSAASAELETLLSVLGFGDDEFAATHADEVDRAKPEPDIVAVALDLVGASAASAVFVGDARWDMIAAAGAGVTAVGVRTGGIGVDELIEAGAVEVVDSVADLLARGDTWPNGSSV